MITLDKLSDHIYPFLTVKEHIQLSKICRIVNAASKCKMAWKNKSIILRNAIDLIHLSAFPVQSLCLSDCADAGLFHLRNFASPKFKLV